MPLVSSLTVYLGLATGYGLILRCSTLILILDEAAAWNWMLSPSGD